MKHSKNLFWFKNVISDEKGIELECLVDIKTKDQNHKGHWLIRVGTTFKLLPARLLANNSNRGEIVVIGKAVRWSCLL